MQAATVTLRVKQSTYLFLYGKMKRDSGGKVTETFDEAIRRLIGMTEG